MGPSASAVLVSASVTAGVAALGATVLSGVSRRWPNLVVYGAPLVLVVSLAAGVASATRAMLVAEDDYRTVLFVLMAGAPIAFIVGLLLARRVRSVERAAAGAAARHERDVQIERARRETIQWLSHDLRTPLTGIRLLAEALQDSPGDAGTRAGRIISEADRMAGMVDDITVLSRLHGDVAHVVDLVAVDDLVSEAVAAVTPIADAAAVTIAAGERSRADVRVDAERAVRALANVVRNAVQHTPTDGVVLIDTALRPGDRVAVTVADGCGGIPEADLERVFEPGFRGDGARTERGLGLGMTIAREVVRADGGDMGVANAEDGRGCVVTMTLPVAPAHAHH